jgi:hypothetical protein
MGRRESEHTVYIFRLLDTLEQNGVADGTVVGGLRPGTPVQFLYCGEAIHLARFRVAFS